MTRRFETNKNGKIEFTPTELKNLLDEVYNEGYNNGKYYPSVVWNPPYRYDYTDWWNKPYITWCSDNCSTTSTITVNGNDYSTTTSANSLNTNY